MIALFERFAISLTLKEAVQITTPLPEPTPPSAPVATGLETIASRLRVAFQLDQLDVHEVYNELTMLRRQWLVGNGVLPVYARERMSTAFGMTTIQLGPRDMWGPQGQPWSSHDLLDHEQNKLRILWLAACTIRRTARKRWRA